MNENNEKVISNVNSKSKEERNVPNLRFNGYTNNWKFVVLKSITEISAGATPKTNIPSYWGGNIRWMNSGELNMKHIFDVEGRITEEGYRSTSTKILPKECVLIGLAGQGKTRGTAAINHIELCTNQSIGAIWPCDELNPLFLYYNIDSRYLELRELSSGEGGRGGLNLNQIGSLKIPICSLEEQKMISDFLSLIDERIDAQSKIIKDLEAFKTLIINQLLTENYFDELSIKDLTKFNYARIIKPSEMKEFLGERLYLSTSSIDKNGIVNFECKISYYSRPSRASMIPFKNSVWFAKMKDTIKVYKSENDDETKYILSTGFYGLLCNENKINSDWLLEIFRSNYFNNQKNKFSEGSSMSGIKDNQLEDIKIKIFKDRQMESYNVKFLNLLNRKIYIENNLLEKYKEQKKYLLSNMFI